ncbi:50S ribosomal protein L5 [Candidatus Gugararchaeum adminiculabundum]|nr:50S ribosomal protein L5 [Candidatus Gugararchaeum adminiculabundum]
MAGPMNEIIVEKVTVNVGVGESGQKLESIRTLIGTMTGAKTVATICKVRNPVWSIKLGDKIGVKSTLRKTQALEFLKKALHAKDNRVSERSFDKKGNFSFGVPEYIDFPGVKYDAKIGIIGFDVCVTLAKKGNRITKRKRAAAILGTRARVTTEEGIEFAKSKLGIEVY